MSQDFVWPLLFWLYAAATLVQLAVWWGVFGKLRSAECGMRNAEREQVHSTALRTPHSALRNPQSAITIIICARNEAENLRRHLPEVLGQQYPGEWEVIVVDDASEDETPAVLQFFQGKNRRLRVLRVSEKKHLGKKHALAQGIAAAKFDNLLLTDADCEPASPHWLSHMAATLQKKPETEIVLGYGPLNPTPGPSPTGRGDVERFATSGAERPTSPLPVGEGPGVGLSSWPRFETALTAVQYLSFALAGMPYMGVGRNLAFKKQVYERVGGFEAHLDVPSGDDDLLVNAAGNSQNVAICLCPESFVFSESKKTWREWARQKHRHLGASKRYRRGHQVVLALISLSHVFHFLLFAVLLAGSGTVSVVLLFLLRSFSVLFLCSKIFPRLRESRLLSLVPIYDALLAAYYGAFVPFSLIARRRTRSWQ